eukprot:jgi/Psemu1/33913/gm1.33913_g
MTPDQQDNTNQDDKEDVPILDLFPSFDQALATFLRDSFDVPKESNSSLCAALIASQYRTWSDFLFIEDINDLTYQDGGARGLDWEERDHYTKKAFKDYCQGIVKARQDSAVTNRATTSPDGPGRSPKPIAQLKYESWIRKPRDETTFPVLQNDATFEHWLVQFKAQLDANGINPTTFLDPYWPAHVLTGYPKALHEKQCAFFWTLLRHVFQGDFSSSCVLYHQRTHDGHQAYFDFVTLHNPVPPPMPPAAPVSTHASVHSTSSTPAVHNSPPTTACKTLDHPTVDNSEPPTGLPGRLIPTPGSIHPALIPSASEELPIPPLLVLFLQTLLLLEMFPLNAIISHIPLALKLHIHLQSTPDGRFLLSLKPWYFIVPVLLPNLLAFLLCNFHHLGHLLKIVSFQAQLRSLFFTEPGKPLYGASFSPVWKPSAYPVGKPLYEAHFMTYVLPAVCINKRHRDAIKLKLYHLHATLLIAHWLYDDVT